MPSASSPSIPRTLIIMGVSGCGKTVIGSILAERLGGLFEDADDFHTVENKAKMKASIPLTDEDRWPWMKILRDRIEAKRDETSCYVLACSALKQIYRDRLRDGDSRSVLQFVYLKGSRELIGARMAARKGHYMPVSLLDSQFAILEEPTDAIIADIDATPEAIAEDVLKQLSQSAP
jgi:gluconokinase